MTSPFHRSPISGHIKPSINQDYLRFIIEVAHYRHPANLKKKIKLILRSVIWRQQTFNWYKEIANRPLLNALVIKQKGLVEKSHKSYLKLSYRIQERTQKLIDHYSIFCNKFDDSSIQKIVFEHGLLLAKIDTEFNGAFELTLNAVDDECKEGELAISLRRDNGQQLSVIRFSFMRNPTGIDLYIAAIQGPKGVGSKEKIAEACKALYGLSPNRLVIESCLALVKQLQVNKVFLVADKQQVFKSKQNKHFSYDVFASDLGGVLNADHDYELPHFIERKKREDTPRKRRAKYQRQHALLDSVLADSVEVLHLHVKN